ncbi:MAG: hypothetical protein DRH04_01550 [Deltaproteobacteria bacterium]|nr:MAG: hypothetical protein DRH04_01550 [Deltaproteobacteria bacterium]
MKKIILFITAFAFLLGAWQIVPVYAADNKKVSDKEVSAYKWGYWDKMVAPAAMRPEFPRPVIAAIPDPDPDPDPKPEPKILPGPPVPVTPGKPGIPAPGTPPIGGLPGPGESPSGPPAGNPDTPGGGTRLPPPGGGEA